MKPLNIHINLTSKDFAAVLNGELHWIDRVANTQRIQTLFLYAPDEGRRKPRRIPAKDAATLADNPEALAMALMTRRLLPRSRKAVLHKGYSNITKEVTITGLKLLTGTTATFHIEFTTQTLLTTHASDARGVEILNGDTLTDANGNTLGTVTIHEVLTSSVCVVKDHAVPLDVFDRTKYFVKI